MVKRPSGNVMESKDYSTGYRTITHDIDVPDRQSHEPSGIRAQAREQGPNRWSVSVTHGPFAERDESGSYYKHISRDQFSGSLSGVKGHLKKAVGTEWTNLRG